MIDSLKLEKKEKKRSEISTFYKALLWPLSTCLQTT